MRKVLVNESSLTGVATAIRGKNGSADTYKPSEMAAAITAISGGGGGSEPVIEALSVTSNGTYTAPDGVDGYSPITVNVPQDGSPPESAFVISGDCSFRFYQGGWDWFINQYSNQITTNDITNCENMFGGSKLTEIPFQINLKNNTSNYISLTSTFLSSKITQAPSFNNNFSYENNVNTIAGMFSSCRYLNYIPDDFFNIVSSSGISYPYFNCSGVFQNCYSLRKLPNSFYSKIRPSNSTSVYSKPYYNMVYNCYCLDEIIGLYVDTTTFNSDAFYNICGNCHRLKNFIFETDNGTPKTANWKNQTLPLNEKIGMASYAYTIINYNSGITADKEVTDDATYQALKNDPDWFTTNVAYSRYNHDSAVATINSLPDTSAYLSANGGSNTIKFKGESGSATDGGAINALTEEEIAVATAKGWTVSFV